MSDVKRNKPAKPTRDSLLRGLRRRLKELEDSLPKWQRAVDYISATGGDPPIHEVTRTETLIKEYRRLFDVFNINETS